MKAIPGLLVLLLLCGCIYDVPLTEESAVPVDPALTGLWQAIPEKGDAEDPDDRLVVLPFNATEYVVVTSPGEDALYFRAYPFHMDGLELIQLEWLGVDKEEGERYHVCRYALKDDLLTIEMLNEDVVSSDLKDPASLRQALVANLRNPELFEELGRYRKLAAD